jgi:MFS family permease
MLSPQTNNKNKTIPMKNSKRIFIYFMTALFLFYEMALQVSPSVMAPDLIRDLSLSTFQLGLMSSVYFYTYTAMQIPSGLLFDHFHPRFLVPAALLFCLIGTFIFSHATNIQLGCIGRLLMGMGSAFAFVSVLVVVSDLFPPKQFALMAGVTQMLAALGAMSGQLPLSYLIDTLGWRSTLIIFYVFGGILALIIWFNLDYEKENPKTKIAPQINSSLWKDFLNLLNHLKVVLANPQSWFIALYACLLWAPMSGFTSLWGVTYLSKTHHLSLTAAAQQSSMMWLGLAVMSPFFGWLSTALNNRRFTLISSALLGFITFGLLYTLHLSPLLNNILLFLAGGACAGQAISFSSVNENNPEAQRATAIGFNNMAVVISGAIFQPLIATLIEKHAHSSDFHTLTAPDLQYGISIIWAAYFVATLVALFFIRETLKK